MEFSTKFSVKWLCVICLFLKWSFDFCTVVMHFSEFSLDKGLLGNRYLTVSQPAWHSSRKRQDSDQSWLSAFIASESCYWTNLLPVGRNRELTICSNPINVYAPREETEDKIKAKCLFYTVKWPKDGLSLWSPDPSNNELKTQSSLTIRVTLWSD